MKRKITYLGLIIIICIGVYFYLSQPVANSNLGGGNFDKKSLCSKLQTGLKQGVDQFNQSQQIRTKETGTTYPAGDYIDQEKFYRVFYSPRLDTCLAVIISQTLLKKDSEYVIYEESYQISDSASEKTVDWLYTIKHGYPYYSIQDVNDKIADYQSTSSKSIIIGQP